MTTTYDADPNTQTVAAAWASSPLGQPEREVRYGFAADMPVQSDEPKSPAKRAILAAALAAGVVGGAVLGVALFDFGDSSLPTVVEKAPAPGHAVVVQPSIPAPMPTQILPQEKAAPTAVAPAPRREPNSAAVATPPVALPPVAAPPVAAPPVAPQVDTTVVIDVPLPNFPPLPPKPEDPDPEPPNPGPPVPPDLDFKLPDPPKPDPKPDFVPDLSLTPVPKPDPKPEPPSLPDLDLQAPVKS